MSKTPKPRPAKKATTGEKIARSHAYSSENCTITAFIARTQLPCAIDRAIRRAVRETYACGIETPGTEKFLKMKSIETRYGVKL